MRRIFLFSNEFFPGLQVLIAVGMDDASVAASVRMLQPTWRITRMF
jgi:hypothetical protein